MISFESNAEYNTNSFDPHQSTATSSGLVSSPQHYSNHQFQSTPSSQQSQQQLAAGSNLAFFNDTLVAAAAVAGPSSLPQYHQHALPLLPTGITHPLYPTTQMQLPKFSEYIPYGASTTNSPLHIPLIASLASASTPNDPTTTNLEFSGRRRGSSTGPSRSNSGSSTVSVNGLTATSTIVTKTSGTPSKKQYSQRSGSACTHCRRSKMKCDGQAPCARCVNSGQQECRYEPPPPTTVPRQRKSSSNQAIIEARLSAFEKRLDRLESNVSSSASSTPRSTHQDHLERRVQELESQLQLLLEQIGRRNGGGESSEVRDDERSSVLPKNESRIASIETRENSFHKLNGKDSSMAYFPLP